ncbi:hypothetical protein CHLNCDRAFT_138527 [Chlorella variabilis]|uniref:Protein kinase domain-containing protein n=1 Tax=Chlorella variabilis TaxID=554065 RepID=E1ZN81_CHLVA|nr:hypothetical protein CHLNCDRAFT_138527 [Chlorella variabilis]EFN52644.1 hypothetical protein CHLNCDRAFT_138527 [Chlorella variabilis]|eukprot:XP_005844746.1 hypothetical protein CHLNCDRAFT_138527 [Chlorella variabilis]
MQAPAAAAAAPDPVPAMHASVSALRQPAAQPAAGTASPDLLPSTSPSLLSELVPSERRLPAGSEQDATPSSVLHRRQPSTPGSTGQPSLGSQTAGSDAAATPRQQQPQPRQPASASSAASGGSSVAAGGVLAQLPSRTRRQLGKLLRHKPPPVPAAAAPPGSPVGATPLPLSKFCSAGAALWDTGSAASGDPLASGPKAEGSEAGSTSEHAAPGGGGPLLRRADILICQDPSGRPWKLGEGGFGLVFKASRGLWAGGLWYHCSTATGLMNGVDEVAVKCIKAEVPSDAELATFHQEVQLLAGLRHRNIVQASTHGYYGACLEPGSLFFVTELMKGGDLYTALRRHPAALRWERLGRRVALDVALGLNYLHRWPEEGVAKIADVGMVRPHMADLLTAQPLMTPLWAAPEVLRRERAGVKADIFSYGLLVWELVSGADIADRQPLALTRSLPPQHQASGAAALAPVVAMPEGAPPLAAHIFAAATQADPALRPNAQQIAEWLRGV